MAQTLTPQDLISISTFITAQCRNWYDTEKKLRDSDHEGTDPDPGWMQLCSKPLVFHEATFLNAFSTMAAQVRLRVLYDKLLFFTPDGYFKDILNRSMRSYPKSQARVLRGLIKRNPELMLQPLLMDIHMSESQVLR